MSKKPNFLGTPKAIMQLFPQTRITEAICSQKTPIRIKESFGAYVVYSFIQATNTYSLPHVHLTVLGVRERSKTKTLSLFPGCQKLTSEKDT